jgi:hypothetical protein
VQRTVLVVDPCSTNGQAEGAQPSVLFDYDTFRAALVAEVERLREPPPKLPFVDRLVFAVFYLATLSFLPDGPSARKAARMRNNTKALEERMSPISLLDWIEQQTEDRIVVQSRNWTLKWLYYRVMPGPAFFSVNEGVQPKTLDLIEAYCPECCVTYLPQQLERQYWSYDHGFLASGGGRSLECPREHVLLKVADWQS